MSGCLMNNASLVTDAKSVGQFMYSFRVGEAGMPSQVGKLKLIQIISTNLSGT